MVEKQLFVATRAQLCLATSAVTSRRDVSCTLHPNLVAELSTFLLRHNQTASRLVDHNEELIVAGLGCNTFDAAENPFSRDLLALRARDEPSSLPMPRGSLPGIPSHVGRLTNVPRPRVVLESSRIPAHAKPCPSESLLGHTHPSHSGTRSLRNTRALLKLDCVPLVSTRASLS